MSDYFDNKELFSTAKTTQYGSHMVMTNVSKQSRKKSLNIDTRFRDEYNYLNNSNTPINYNYNNAASYTITLPERYNDVKSIAVTNVEIPMSFYNISKELGNNYFSVKNIGTGAITTITIADGQYTSTTLSTEINTDLSNNGFLGVISYSTIPAGGSTATGFSYFSTASGNYSIIFNLDSQKNFEKFNLKSKIGWMLGYRNVSYTITSGNPAKSEAFIDLYSPRYIYLVVDEHSNGKQNSFIAPLSNSIIQKNILARISVDYQIYPFRSILMANLTGGLLETDIRSYTGKTDIQRLVVQLINENGQLINLNGLDFSFCMQLEYE